MQLLVDSNQFGTPQKSRVDENLCLHVGRIRKFIKHTIKIINSDSLEKEMQHLFCQIDWYVKHDQKNWFFGMSAIMCKNFT